MIPSASALLDWYTHNRRVLPWRALPGQKADPYAVWLSEIMLQQTTVTTVMPYYERFLKRYPTVQALAEAPLQDILALWAGLGYYSRARNLHACARIVAKSGAFPDSVAGLQALPGIGVYTARAIAAIAFSHPVVPVDGNVERITARLYAIAEPLPVARRHLGRLASDLNKDQCARTAPSDFAQALFDLGATICTPRRPLCLVCPWQSSCMAHTTGESERFPARAARKSKPERFGTVFLMQDRKGAVWLRQRAESGLLGGMTEIPGTAWTDISVECSSHIATAPVIASWREIGKIRHVFTHFTLHLTVLRADLKDFDQLHNQEGYACCPDALKDQALPTVMRKCLALAE